MTHIILDLDDTLVNTSKLRHYMCTRAGREYAVKNIKHLPTALCSPALEDLIEICEKYGDTLSVVTNSPNDYAQAILRKHKILRNAEILANAHKPSSTYLEIAVQMSGVPKKETVVIGDSAIDILAAHSAGIASIGAAWGYSSAHQLELAEPQEIVADPALLINALAGFEKGKFRYEPRRNPARFEFMPKSEFNTADPEFRHVFLDVYQPWAGGNQEFNEFSNKILRFKASKDFSLKEIKDFACDRYFAGSAVKRGCVYKKILQDFVSKTGKLIDKLDVGGKILFIAAPNSFPEFCYKTDVNQVFLMNVVKNNINQSMSKERVLRRVFPKLESHITGANSAQEHYSTVGFNDADLKKYDSAVLFDDVFTSGMQIACLAKMLRYFGFTGKFYAVTLGKTRE